MTEDATPRHAEGATPQDVTNNPHILLVYIDTQGSFVFADGELPVAGAQDLVGALSAYAASIDPTEVAAFLATFDTHVPEAYLGSAENLGDEAAGAPGFPIHCVKGTPGWENVVNLRIPAAADVPVYRLEKDVFDMFAKPDFKVERLFADEPAEYRDTFLSLLQADGINTVRIAGFASDFCVNWAIQGFLAAGFKVEVIEHLVAGIGMDIRQTAATHFPDRVSFI
jgi:nicotinamidase/pyrazinamidase